MDNKSWDNMTAIDLLDAVAEAVEWWLESSVVDLVWDTKDRTEWIFCIGYNLWDDWWVYYDYSIEYHNPKRTFITNADKDTFKVLWGWYAKDKNFVYFKWVEIGWVDSEAFEYLSLPDELKTIHNGSWCFWDWKNDKVIINGSIVAWVSLREFGYNQELWLWTDWNIAIRSNYVINSLSMAEKRILSEIIKPSK